MKILAHISNNYNSDIYPINLACWLKKNKPEDWESRDYYDLAKLRPMRPSCRKDGGSSYSYKPGTNPPGHGRGSKGIAHELVQEYICRLEGSMWQFQVFDNNFNENIQRVEDEYTITDPDDPENYRNFIFNLSNSNREFYGAVSCGVSDINDAEDDQEKSREFLIL